MNVWGYTEILLIIVIELVIYIKKSFICFKKYFENNSSKIIKSLDTVANSGTRLLITEINRNNFTKMLRGTS